MDGGHVGTVYRHQYRTDTRGDERDPFTAIHSHRDAVEAVGDADEILGAVARVLLAWADSTRPADADLALIKSTESSDRWW